ncbi:dihydrofolate reductase family protein [Nonomuraea sp. NPDC048916]|uniref:dihydrofolate reductase family protein n=1 Tax=Nonomuraea sp. NPDC048916 TaxID=3154232 RepID=UPI0033EA2A0B
MQYNSEDAMAYAFTMTTGCDALMLGRVTYEGMAQAWPNMGGNPYSDHVNAITKYVVASQPVDTGAWDPTVVIPGDDLAAQVAKIKEQDGKDILIWGCGRLTDALMEHGLLDEYRIWIYPVIRGEGQRLFRDGTETTLELTDSTAFDSGVVVLTYRPASAGGDTGGDRDGSQRP